MKEKTIDPIAIINNLLQKNMELTLKVATLEVERDELLAIVANSKEPVEE